MDQVIQDSTHRSRHPQPSYQSPDLGVYQTTSQSANADARSQNIPASNSNWQRFDTNDRIQHPQPSETMSVQSVVETINPENSVPEVYSSSAPKAKFDTDLPPYDLLYTLVDLYFKHVNTWCPILDRKATFDTIFGLNNN